MSELRIQIRHADRAVQDRVRAWFVRRPRIAALDGSRSIRLPHPEKAGMILKIKGAGLNGSTIRFGVRHRRGPASPVFDFDGRRMEDTASGHDNAFLGATSFQQAAVEYAMSRKLESLGYPVVPCVGYGRVDEGPHTAWFSVFEQRRDWTNVVEHRSANIKNGRILVEIAVRHHLIGYFWFVEAADGRILLKDLHPFRLLDPLNASQLSWTLQVIAALNVRCLASRRFGSMDGSSENPEELASLPLMGVLPDASANDYTRMKSIIVKRYIIQQQDDFSSSRLYEDLQSTRIGAALLKMCPDDFVKWR